VGIGMMSLFAQNVIIMEYPVAKKKVVHVKFTNMACSPDETVRAINKYSEKYEAVLLNPNDAISYADIPIIKDMGKINEFDVVHFHNKFSETDRPKIIQYHSPTAYVDLSFEGKKLVIAQFHATLRDYISRGCIPIRNIIDIDGEEYAYKQKGHIKIGFSPSQKYNRGVRAVEAKGHLETKDILERIKSRNPHVDFDVIHGVGIEECIKRKSDCNIVIDECVTNSYHRSGLEGLGVGALTICSLDAPVISVLKSITGSDHIPFENIWMDNLETKLQEIINLGIDHINSIGQKNRKWMADYWHPRLTVNQLEEIYDEL
jgi:hypothetical protein